MGALGGGGRLRREPRDRNRRRCCRGDRRRGGRSRSRGGLVEQRRTRERGRGGGVGGAALQRLQHGGERRPLRRDGTVRDGHVLGTRERPGHRHLLGVGRREQAARGGQFGTQAVVLAVRDALCRDEGGCLLGGGLRRRGLGRLGRKRRPGRLREPGGLGGHWGHDGLPGLFLLCGGDECVDPAPDGSGRAARSDHLYRSRGGDGRHRGAFARHLAGVDLDRDGEVLAGEEPRDASAAHALGVDDPRLRTVLLADSLEQGLDRRSLKQQAHRGQSPSLRSRSAGRRHRSPCRTAPGCGARPARRGAGRGHASPVRTPEPV